MCLAIPGKITKIMGTKALIDYGGVQRQADISLIDAHVGNHIIVHAGFAIHILSEHEAEETLKLFEELLNHA